MEADSQGQPAVRMKDRWYEYPIVAVAFWAGLICFLWWDKQADPARLSQVAFPTALFIVWWAGRDRQLAKRIEALERAVQGQSILGARRGGSGS